MAKKLSQEKKNVIADLIEMYNIKTTDRKSTRLNSSHT